MASEIRVNSLSSRTGLSTVTFTDTGPIFSGITTFQDNSGFNVGTGGSIFSPASNTVTLGTNDAERLRITSDGKVGIGTDNPGAKTHIDSTTSNTPLVVEASQNNRSRIVFRNNVETGTECNIELFDDDLRFVTNSGERLRITSAGKIGIGHQQEGQITKELTIRPANDGGIRFVRPGASGASVMSHLELTTTTSGSAFPSGEAYTVKYNTINNDQIFTTYEGGGTGGNISFQTGSGSGNEVERLRIASDGDIEYKYDDADTDAEIGASQIPHGLRIYNTNNTLGRLAGIHFSHGSAGTANAGIFHETTNTSSGSTTCLGDLVFYTKNTGVSSMTEKIRINSDGHVLPGANNAYDLGSTAKGWRNVYMNDLNLSNMNGDTNDVDGTQGSWTIQEGKDDLYIINRLNGKKFKIKMEEIS